MYSREEGQDLPGCPRSFLIMRVLISTLVMRDSESGEMYVLSIYFLLDPVLGGIKNC